MTQNIFFQYLLWHFLDVPKNILVGWKNFLRFGLNYFSLFLLLKTFFSPWRKYRWVYPRGFDIGKYFEVFLSNLFSSIVGAIIRIFLIVIGVLVEVFIFFAGGVIFVGWFLLPILLISGLFFGLTNIF